MSKGKAILCSLETPVLLCLVVGQFDKVSKHVGFHRDTAHNLIPVQDLFTRRHGLPFEECSEFVIIP